jgi:hypothetical protein
VPLSRYCVVLGAGVCFFGGYWALTELRMGGIGRYPGAGPSPAAEESLETGSRRIYTSVAKAIVSRSDEAPEWLGSCIDGMLHRSESSRRNSPRARQGTASCVRDVRGLQVSHISLSPDYREGVVVFLSRVVISSIYTICQSSVSSMHGTPLRSFQVPPTMHACDLSMLQLNKHPSHDDFLLSIPSISSISLSIESLS